MEISQSVCSIEELESAPREVIASVHRTGRPLIVSVDGHPDVVVLPAEVFADKMTAMKVAVELAAGDS